MSPALTRRWTLGFAASLPFSPALAATAERRDLRDIFRQHGANGTMAVVDAASGEATVVDGARAARRYVPASTFKIPNALIALETGVVRDVDEVLPYGGGQTRNPAWARDMSLRDAMPVSNVPVFQGVARRVGLARYRDWLARLDYGNRDPGNVVDRFWLEGPLRVSALEEARFNARLARKALPASERAQAQVHDIIRQDSVGGATLYAKTGWHVQRGQTSIGWWSGWVAQGARVHAFTLNMDMPQMAMAPKRIEIGRAVLKQLGLYG